MKKCYCDFCGREFESRRTTKLYCSNRCNQNFHSMRKGKKFVKNCYVCGEKLNKWEWTCQPISAVHEGCKDKVLDVYLERTNTTDAEKKREKERRKKRIESLNKLIKEAKESNLSYGQLQAKKYMEAHPWVRPKLK